MSSNKSGQTVQLRRFEEALRRTGMTGRQFTELGPYPPSGYIASAFFGRTIEAQIQRAIVEAKADGVTSLCVTRSMLPYDPTLVTFDSAVRLYLEGGPPDYYDVRAYGARTDGTGDAGAAWNMAVNAMPASGGTLYVGPGTYALTTAFSFGAATNVLLYIDKGVTLTGSALPAPASNNTIVDYRSGVVAFSPDLTEGGFTGTLNQTLRHNGTQFVATSVLKVPSASTEGYVTIDGSALSDAPKYWGLNILNQDETGTLEILTHGNASPFSSYLWMASARGTRAVPAATSNGQILGGYQFGGWAPTIGYRTGVSIEGVAGSLWSATNTESKLDFYTTGLNEISSTKRWTIQSDGMLVAGTDNAYDIGASGATRPRTLWLGTKVDVGSRAAVTAPAGDGTVFVSDGVATGQLYATGTRIYVGSNTAHGFGLITNGTERWQVAHTTGHFLAATDNTHDIGASGATRPRTGYFGTSLVVVADPGGTAALRVGGAARINTTMGVGADFATTSGALVRISGATDAFYRGVDARATQTAATTAGSGPIGVQAATEVNAPAVTVSAAYNIFVTGTTVTAGTLTSAYGLYMNDIAGATTNYAIRTGAGLTQFGDTNQVQLGTITAQKLIRDDSVTWNAGGVTFTGWKLNVTATAYTVGSKLVDIQHGATSRFFLQLSTGTAGFCKITAPDNQPSLEVTGSRTGSGSEPLLFTTQNLNTTGSPSIVHFNAVNAGGAGASTQLLRVSRDSNTLFAVGWDGNVGIGGGITTDVYCRIGQGSNLPTAAEEGLQVNTTLTATGGLSHWVVNILGGGVAGTYTTPDVFSLVVGTYVKATNQTITTWTGLDILAPPTAGTKRAIRTNDGEWFKNSITHSVVLGNAALATTATDGFLYIPSCAGTPTGVPTSKTGTIPLVYDATNNILYAYSNGSWRTH